MTSKPVLITIAILLVAAALFAFDNVSNAGRAYGNISINGVAVGGMDRDEMRQALMGEFGARVSHAQVAIYGDEESRQLAQKALNAAAEAAADEDIEQDTDAEVDYWITDALSLKANVPYEQAIDKALAVGREDGGIGARLALTVAPVEIDMTVQLDPNAVENLAAAIDNAIGDPRQDTTAEIINAMAYPVEGHDGMMIDRDWLTGEIAHAMMYEESPSFIIAELTNAPSRITLQEAQQFCDCLNHALGSEAQFTYKSKRWTATDIDLGDWTRVDVVKDGNYHKLQATIDSSLAIPAIADGADAHVSMEDTTVTFEKDGDQIWVHTGGSGNLPEIAAAVSELDQDMYGPNGIAWSDRLPEVIKIEIGESDKPETLTLSQALDLEIVSVIGEFTSEYSTYVGTENRNHNIQLAADTLTDCIVKADGGTWSFNDIAGDTTEEAGYWTAGSIIDGEIVDSVGGGVCQVATTIFNAVYNAGLPVPERHNHSMYLANYPDGLDSGISYPYMDLVWQNDLPSDVLLTVECGEGTVTAKLYSVYTGYTVETDTGEWIDGDKYTIRFEEDETLAKDAYSKKTTGKDGQKISVTRTVKDKDGKVVTFDSFSSVYEPVDEIYLVGPDTDTAELKAKLTEETKEEG